jgi:hypothetical protein
MKKIFFSAIALLSTSIIYSQTYPDPEFTNEPYYLQKKDSNWILVRLEKSTSSMETKTKLGGFGGSETEYTMDGNSSSVRIKAGTIPLFIVSNSAAASNSITTDNHSDSIMRANGVDPNLLQQGMGGMMDPGNRFTLYKAESGGGKRIVLLQKNRTGPFASKKVKSSDKYSFSVKKIRDGYWELVPDKTLPSGEYVFSALDVTGGSVRGPSMLLFSFGID